MPVSSIQSPALPSLSARPEKRVLSSVLVAVALLAMAVIGAHPAHAQTAELQVIHNAAGFGDVDIYVLDSGGSQLAKLDNFPFRGALIVDVPAGEDLEVTVNGPGSSGSSDSQVASVSPINLTDGTFNQAFAIGSSAGNFQLLLEPDQNKTAAGGAGTVDLLAGHQSPDAPTVDVLTRGIVAVDDIAYTEFSNGGDYFAIPFEDYILRVGEDDNAGFVATFDAPLTTLGVDGSTLTALASGFLFPTSGQPGLTLIAVPPSNTSTNADEISEASNADENVVVLSRAPQTVVINEFFANPTTMQDANGDGVNGSDSQEEFVEIVNIFGGSVDISGYVIEDEGGNTYTFPDNITLAENEGAVVFGGGTPTGFDVFTDTGLPGLNNGGDEIYLKDGQGTVIDRVTYDQFAPFAEGESTTRNPDYFGGMVLSATDAGGPAFTPGRTNDDAKPLPVELAAFAGAADGRDVVLTWRTLSETGNSGFEVQQKTETGYRVVGFRRGQGTTTEATSYRFRIRDVDPGTHTFRLRQVDVDGTASLSPAVDVTVGLREAYLLTSPVPSPALQTARLRLQVRQAQEVTVGLYDVLGRQVRTLYRGALEAGRSQSIEVDAADLSGGLYLVRARGESFAATRRLTVVR